MLSHSDIGKAFFFFTPNYNFIGKVVSILTDDWVLLEQASWVACTGRLTEFLEKGTTKELEVEYIGEGLRVKPCAVFNWEHEVFTETLPKDFNNPVV